MAAIKAAIYCLLLNDNLLFVVPLVIDGLYEIDSASHMLQFNNREFLPGACLIYFLSEGIVYKHLGLVVEIVEGNGKQPVVGVGVHLHACA